MNDYMLLMHDDAPPGPAPAPDAWPSYIAKLHKSGVFRGGSSLGQGVCFKKAGATTETLPLEGYVLVQASDLNAARALLEGNPVYEAGGTVEIRELVRDS